MASPARSVQVQVSLNNYLEHRACSPTTRLRGADMCRQSLDPACLTTNANNLACDSTVVARRFVIYGPQPLLPGTTKLLTVPPEGFSSAIVAPGSSWLTSGAALCPR